jgi:hypothetical protein
MGEMYLAHFQTKDPPCTEARLAIVVSRYSLM